MDGDWVQMVLGGFLRFGGAFVFVVPWMYQEMLFFTQLPCGGVPFARRAVNLIQSRGAFSLRSWEILTWVYPRGQTLVTQIKDLDNTPKVPKPLRMVAPVYDSCKATHKVVRCSFSAGGSLCVLCRFPPLCSGSVPNW